ncbi:MAG TPA: peptidoglycan-associated lipoprotein Pal [Casimicrobiaceae bacterium]|nr:peptidoglycan-associated lipoprotein Pal [Casimicrobiaceae bacterium]
MRKLLFGAFLIALLAGCSSTPQKPAPVDEGTPTPNTSSTAPGAATGTVPGGGVSGSTTPGGAQAGSTNPLRDPNNILSKRSVYFDFDSSDIKPEYRGLIEAHARYLAANGNARVTIQGNTDERGSREYNIALGQRRADAVRQLMRVLGASDAQIETVSFGKEKPKNPGHDEAAWAENRRADIVYAGE